MSSTQDARPQTVPTISVREGYHLLVVCATRYGAAQIGLANIAVASDQYHGPGRQAKRPGNLVALLCRSGALTHNTEPRTSLLFNFSLQTQFLL
jgi:hypothetical protein